MFLQKKIRCVWNSITQNRSNFAKNLIKVATGTFGVQIASVGLTFITSLVLARLLEAKGFGIFTYAMSWATLLSIPATLG
ncbi:MAG: oligosaccharide flippase family protein, partial [Waterburya sp.]